MVLFNLMCANIQESINCVNLLKEDQISKFLTLLGISYQAVNYYEDVVNIIIIFVMRSIYI